MGAQDEELFALAEVDGSQVLLEARLYLLTLDYLGNLEFGFAFVCGQLFEPVFTWWDDLDVILLPRMPDVAPHQGFPI